MDVSEREREMEGKKEIERRMTEQNPRKTY